MIGKLSPHSSSLAGGSFTQRRQGVGPYVDLTGGLERPPVGGKRKGGWGGTPTKRANTGGGNGW